MKNFLLMLLLANILYFVWGTTSEKPSQPGIDFVTEADLGPPLNVTTERDRDTVASVGAVLGSGEPSALQAVVGRACVSIGPFATASDAEMAVNEYSDEGMRTVLRETQGDIFVGHWVRIINVADDAEAISLIALLAEGGLGDAYPVRTEGESMKISLGVFGDLEGAEKIELQAKSLGLPADISPRTRAGELFFVDIGLPPGKGAGAMIERYGQERVLLRDAATCPH